MSNKNANVDIEAVERHELTTTIPGNKPAPLELGLEPHSKPHSKPLESSEDGDSGGLPLPLNSTKDNEDCDVGYITQLDKDGNIQQVPMKFEGEAEDEPNPLADFMSGKQHIYVIPLHTT